MRVKMVNGKK